MRFHRILVISLIVGGWIFFPPKSLPAPVVLDNTDTEIPVTSGGIVVFNTPRTLSFPPRVDQWETWIRSVTNPTLDNEVSQITAGILLQVGFYTSSADNRESEIVFRYFTGASLTEQRKMFLVNSHVYKGSAGNFAYWRTGWLSLLPGQNLEIQEWFTGNGNTTPVARFIGTVNGVTDTR